MLNENPYLIRAFRVLLNTNLHPENKLTELELNWLAIYAKDNLRLRFSIVNRANRKS